jgi:nucleoside-diphosphate-sugar epimerase
VGITVAVTGPTGEIGMAAVAALEHEPGVERILGMARRPFDPGRQGWTKTDYRQGDILDRAAVEALVADADVVVHLAFVIMGSREQSRRVNIAGARNVFEAIVAGARPHRLIYTSSVAAYGYRRDNPRPLTEDLPARGSTQHYYSEQKAELEALLRETTAGSSLEVYVLRPCIVVGPRATALARAMPWNLLGPQVSGLARSARHAIPAARPVFPDPGIALQLVHHDDVASAIAAMALGRGTPGIYNVAGDGEVTLGDVASALGGRAVRVPHAAALVTSDLLARVPHLPWQAEWIHVARAPVVMDTSKAKRGLGWRPQYTSAQALAAMAAVVGD